MPTLLPLGLGWMASPAALFDPRRSGGIRYPVPGYAVVHERGVVVFDTGLRSSLMGGTAELEHLAGAFTVELTTEDLVEHRLQEHGLEVEAVTHVVNSHLNFDHCGRNGPFAGATTLVQRAEWDALASGDPTTYVGVPVDEIGAGHLQLLDGPHDVFGDGTVVCVPTPGHTAGHQSLLVRSADGPDAALLVADACYLQDMLADDVLPSFGHDPGEQRRSHAALRTHAAEGVALLFSHDVDRWDEVPAGLRHAE